MAPARIERHHAVRGAAGRVPPRSAPFQEHYLAKRGKGAEPDKALDTRCAAQSASGDTFDARITDKNHRYGYHSEYGLREGAIEMTVYPGSVITFFEK